MAILGRNGSGKSTLLQIIAGTLRATNGSVDRQGRVAALLELGSGFNPELTGRTNVFMNGSIYGIDADEINARMHEIEDFAEIGTFIDQPVKTYSSGMMMRLAFSVQVLLDPQILIIDEALSVGDIFFQQKCFDRMRKLSESGTSILFVSHDLVTVSQFTDTAMVLDHGRCAFYGKSSVAVKEYQIMERARTSPPPAKTPVPKKSADPGLVDAPSQLTTSTTSSAVPIQRGDLITVNSMAEIPLSSVLQVGKERASITRLTVSDGEGNPASAFEQGTVMIIQCDIQCHIDFNSLSAGISIKDRTNVFVHGKHSFQHNLDTGRLSAGECLRFQFGFVLDLSPGVYSMDIGIIDVLSDPGAPIAFDRIESCIERICLNDGFASFQVLPRTNYEGFQLPFYGLADLKGSCLFVRTPNS